MTVTDGPLTGVPSAALPGPGGLRLMDCYSLATSVSLGSLTWPGRARTPGAMLLCAAGSLERPGQARSVVPRSLVWGPLGTLVFSQAEGKALVRGPREKR